MNILKSIIKNDIFIGLSIAFSIVFSVFFLIENGLVLKTIYHAEYLVSDSVVIEFESDSYINDSHPCSDVTIRVTKRDFLADTFCGGKVLQYSMVDTKTKRNFSYFYSVYSFEKNKKRTTVVYLNERITKTKEEIIAEVKEFVKNTTEQVMFDLTTAIELEKTKLDSLEKLKNNW